MNSSTETTRVATEREIQLDGFTFAAREWGRTGEDPVLAVHGWLDNAASFDTLAPLLTHTHLVAIDLPGHGRTQHLGTGSAYHFIDGVAYIKAVVDHLGWKTFTLLGHSMGAGMATLFAGTYPKRVHRLILLEGLGPLSQTAADAPDRLAKSISSEARLKKPRVFDDLDHAIRARAKGNDLDDRATRILVTRGTTTMPEGHVVFQHDHRLKVPSRLRMTEDVVTAFLTAIACPVLIVWADDGWPFPREAVAAREAKISKLTVKWVSGGHHVHLTHPQRVAPLIVDFLKS